MIKNQDEIIDKLCLLIFDKSFSELNEEDKSELREFCMDCKEVALK